MASFLTAKLFLLSSILLAKKRKFRPLIPVENGTVMLLSRAKERVAAGTAVIINGRVRFLDPTGAGYERAPSVLHWGGRQSGAAGPIVMQAKGRVFKR